MNTEIITIGTELLLGQILDTNAVYLAKKLADLGINLYFKTNVGDNRERLLQALEVASQRADLIITTGGLGPTEDDLTVETIAEFWGEDLILDADSLKKLEEFCQARKISLARNMKKQALRPKNAQIIPNPVGTAPGIILEQRGRIIISFPGVPKEMYAMMEQTVIPYLKSKVNCIIKSKTLRLFGLGESLVEEKIIDLIKKQSNPTIAPYAKDFEVHLRLTAKDECEQKADYLIQETEKKIRERLDKYIYGVNEQTLEEIVAHLLEEKKQTLALAESCTGGLIAHRLTNVSGISQYLDRGVISYSNKAKMEVLGVKHCTLESHGAVSSETAVAMARGVREISRTDFGLAVTGIAGPTGGSKEKPVGLVFIALSTRQGETWQQFNFGGDRLGIKNRTAQAALMMLKNYLEVLKNG